MNTRREFVQGLGATVGVPFLAAGAGSAQPGGSDVGSLFPFIRAQAVKTDFPSRHGHTRPRPSARHSNG